MTWHWTLPLLSVILLMPLSLLVVMAATLTHVPSDAPLLTTRFHPPMTAATQMIVDPPPLEILFPPADHLLALTELHVEIAIRRDRMSLTHQRAAASNVCIGMKPVFVPADIHLHATTSELAERCFSHSVNLTSFHISGLVPGVSYSVTVALTVMERVVGISMRTFQVASLKYPGLRDHLSIADALEMGVQFHQSGARTQATDIYRQVLELFPNHLHALHLLGLSKYQDGNVEEAMPLIERALRGNASEENFQNSMGLCLKALGHTKEAIQHFRKALELRPSCIEASLNLGDAWQSLGNWEEAMHEYRKVVATLLDANYDRSKKSNHEKVVKDASGRMCELVRVSDGWYEAERCLSEALVRWPNEPMFHNDRGNLLMQAGQFEAALSEYEMAADLGSYHGNVYVADVLESMGETERSIKHYEKILEVYSAETMPHMTRTMVMKATVLPRILPATQSLIDDARMRMQLGMFDLLQNFNTLETTELDPSRIAFSTAVTVNAHNRNNRVLKDIQAELYYKLLISENIVKEAYVSSYAINPLSYRQARSKSAAKSKRLRIGFISRFFFSPAVGLYMDELIPQFDSSRFETFVFAVGLSKSMKVAEQVEQIAEHIIALPKDLRTAREEVQAADLDIIVYPELGMDKTTYFLSFYRLAPVQTVWWGNADTSCVPTIDIYISTEFEKEGFTENYCERIYQTKGMGIYHKMLEQPDANATRDEIRAAIQERFGIPSTFHFYLTIESILHMHPDFDRAIQLILERDPDAHMFFLTSSTRRRWKDMLLDRIETNIGVANAERVHFFFDVDGKQELSLLTAADSVLSSIHLTRPRAAMQAFTVGVPVVTLPGSFWGSRITYGFYQQMGIDDVVATSLENYADLAVKLATNPKFRSKVAKKIKRRRSRLSEDKQAVRQWEQLFDYLRDNMVPRFQEELAADKSKDKDTNVDKTDKSPKGKDEARRQMTDVVHSRQCSQPNVWSSEQEVVGSTC
ncbi:TPA: hypothetical protein N0F65_003803 [Lagenidium giganteum]|uniref:protein O-GlcNAc transferase n=1 Tax=Lagenidium giganteum TaxID=4803 RepID=A0AAV2YVT3_9STRA|nr:TPA: hypothetical protein N0F65_003803 [Lagenidium giganteum]